MLAGTFVRLEPLSTGHVEALCKVGLDPELWRWTISKVHDAEGMLRWVDQAIAEREQGRSIPFATLDRATGTVVGSTRFGNIDARNRRVEIGWTWIAKPWQRTSINTEAKLLMLTHAFEQLRCARVELKTDRLNQQSRTAILRLGAQEEGVLRQHMLTDDGRFRDSVYYSILDREWPAVRANLYRLLEAR